MEKKRYNVAIPTEIIDKFKDKCKDLGIKKENEALAVLMSAFADGQIKLEFKTELKYRIFHN